MARSIKPTSVPKFPSDWMGSPDVQAMTWEQRGIYDWLLMQAWQVDPPCTIPADEVSQARQLGLPLAKWRKLAPEIIKCWKQFGDGRLVQERLRREYDYLVGKAEAGSKGGMARAERASKLQAEVQANSKQTSSTIHDYATDLPPSKPQAPPLPSPIPLKENTATSAPARASRSDVPSERLSGLHLSPDQACAADRLGGVLSQAFRPKGQAGKDWELPHHETVQLWSFVDAFVSGKPALIEGVEKFPHESEIVELIGKTATKDSPISVRSLCKFIGVIWERCQREGCLPGAPIKRTRLAVTKPVETNQRLTEGELNEILKAGKEGRRA